jgi:hypothetical protein
MALQKKLGSAYWGVNVLLLCHTGSLCHIVTLPQVVTNKSMDLHKHGVTV